MSIDGNKHFLILSRESRTGRASRPPLPVPELRRGRPGLASEEEATEIEELQFCFRHCQSRTPPNARRELALLACGYFLHITEDPASEQSTELFVGW